MQQLPLYQKLATGRIKLLLLFGRQGAVRVILCFCLAASEDVEDVEREDVRTRQAQKRAKFGIGSFVLSTPVMIEKPRHPQRVELGHATTKFCASVI